ncbi:rhodanese-like domain-containing protein [Cyanobacterium sp. Dongsha4]|uniref:rhodanese-like domain-containing protein n=1 Tax=Cyanobacterium sp. DS4 TaxID=2878255 RepID=UPI002E80B449|nr:rhodanese-like domain-containing protein [Cyanobacterium sp. Dongsha4]WVK99289.1 rhodanese-like domain-containing protein [Cyanobacterium sp. Dongsha4]
MVCIPVKKEKIILISPLQLYAKLSQESVTLVDVRELSEYKQGHITGALLKPTSLLTTQELHNLAQQDNLVIYCRSGKRSGDVAQQLIAMGKKFVFDLEGGILGWQSHHLPVEL